MAGLRSPKSKLFSLAAIAFGMALPLQSHAQEAMRGIGFETGISTLGAYIGPSYKMNDRFTARIPLYFGSTTTTQTFEGNPVSGKFDTASSALVADFHPFQGAFRVSGGVAVGGYNVTGKVTNPKFNNNTYVGVADVTVKQSNDIVPVLSIGYAKTFNNGFGLVAEVGAKIGTYTISASDNFVPAAQKAQYAADVAKANSDLQKMPAIPFITLGVSYRF